jgi:hypothetical protein
MEPYSARHDKTLLILGMTEEDMTNVGHQVQEREQATMKAVSCSAMVEAIAHSQRVRIQVMTIYAYGQTESIHEAVLSTLGGELDHPMRLVR